MTIHTSEVETQSSDICEVYQFEINGAYYYYTSFYKDILLDGIIYTAEALERTGFSFTSDPTPRVCTLSFPNINPIAQALHSLNEAVSLSVSITRYFLDDPTHSESVFIGSSTGINFNSGLCVVEFKTIVLELERQICRIRMQALCNNQLFDNVCGKLAADYEVQAAVTVSVDGKTLSSVVFAAFDDDYFTLGKCLYNGIYHYISSHVGEDIKIQYPFSGLIDGTTISFWPGCSKHPGEACIPKFNNLDNFVGMPYIPLKDSQETAITNG
jgi:uncharacterized phage protein (TIGR02218 family)